MATAILRSHDCFQGRLRHNDFTLTMSSDKSQRTSNPNPNPNPKFNQNRRQKRNPVAVDTDFQGRDRSRSTVVVKGPGANLVMGQVKILKRGEKLSPEPALANSNKESFDLILGSTDRLGPDPSSVPVPEFLAKKNGAATSGLRRLLRLDLV